MCGGGQDGQLGLGNKDNQVARAVFDGEAVLMAAAEGGGVYTFGRGVYGRLGHGDYENQIAPRRVPAAFITVSAYCFITGWLAFRMAFAQGVALVLECGWIKGLTGSFCSCSHWFYQKTPDLSLGFRGALTFFLL